MMTTQRFMRNAIISAALMLASPAYSFDGTDLYRFCSHPSHRRHHQICMAYIRGVTEGMLTAELFKTKLVPCFHQMHLDDPTINRVRVEKYMKDNPTDLKQDAVLVIMLALINECDRLKNAPIVLDFDFKDDKK